MKLFAQREVREAIEHAAAGGQALHVFDGRIADALATVKPVPGCFRGRAEVAHLFDQDRARLAATVRRLGVRVVKVEREGQPGQHVDLCGGPLARAKELVGGLVLPGLPPIPDARQFKKELQNEFFGRSPANNGGQWR